MTEFASLRITGGLLSSAILDQVFAGDPQVPGTGTGSYGLERGESVRQQASRSWLYLLDVWQEYQRRIAEGDEAGGAAAAEPRSARVTRERWLRILLRELGFHDLGADGTIELAGKSFPVSHRAGTLPVHLLGWQTDLDHRTPGVTARAPQSMLQEVLNRDDDRLWALLSNGATLRLLRDSASLVGSAYVEFDLDAIFDGELFSDFVLLYLTCHQSRFASQGDDGPASCYLEQWRTAGAEQGERALEQLRVGVEKAITILGTGLLSYPDNPHLRARLDPARADLRLDDLNRALLRIVYRLLFWFVAEERHGLLIPDPPDADAGTSTRLREARDRYTAYFSAARLRQLARRRRGTRHSDLWESVQLVFDGLGTVGGIPELALPGIGGIFETQQDDGRPLPLDEPLAGARLSNLALLEAVRALSIVTVKGGSLRRVDFGNLGAEELGSVYESLLERIPRYDHEQRNYSLQLLAGNDRKESGTYYTPTSLVECLLDSALDPLLDEACRKPGSAERIAALLDLTVCDPACGSGHFLVAAGRRIAKRVAAEETGEPEPPAAAIRSALRRVTSRCIYGVDINPMAAELAKVALCLEALEPGKPLAFLDENIRVGNALLGTTPAMLAAGIPAAAFRPIEGDDKKVASALKKQNEAEQAGQADLFAPAGIPVTNAELAKRAQHIVRDIPDNLEDLHIHQQREALELAASAELQQQKLLADGWCAAFMQPKTDDARRTAITQSTLDAFVAGEETLDSAAARELVRRLTRQYRFFHWHLEFPHIFRAGNDVDDVDSATGWSGGFACVIGNPPWERVKLQEQEFFAAKDRPDIAGAANAAERKKKIKALETSDRPADQALYADFQSELRTASGWSHFLRESGRYPLTGRGDVNTYAVFAETARTIIAPPGRAGIIVPTGIATDATTAPFFRDLVEHRSLDSLLDFVTNPEFWQEIGHGRMRFSLLTIGGIRLCINQPEFATLVKHPSALPPRGRRIKVAAADLLLLNPNTGTCPMFQTERDAEITIGIYKRIPILWRDDPDENPWQLSFLRMFDMANHARMFNMQEELERDGWVLQGNAFVRDGQRMLPLYEAKLVHHFDHRLSCYSKRPEDSRDTELPRLDLAEKQDPYRFVVPRYWVQEFDTKDEKKSTRDKTVYSAVGVSSRLAAKHWTHGWLLGWRDICRSTDERTVICAAIPRAAVGDKFLLAFTESGAWLLQANLSSLLLDYVARQKFAGTSLKYYLLKQLPVLPPTAYSDSVCWLAGKTSTQWITSRVLELSYTTWDMEAFARDLGDDGLPFQWDEERRSVMRAELDAAYFHLYGLQRDDVDYVMQTFTGLSKNETRQFGEFRSKRLILERYDAMSEAVANGGAYETILSPPPGRGLRHPAHQA